MKAYLDTNCIIYLLERNPQREALVIARIAALRAAGDELAVGDLSRAECLIGPFKSGDAGLEARYRAFFADPDVFSFYLSSLSGGFCLGGNLPQDRRPRAFEFLYDPSQLGPKPVEELPTGSTKFWGCPNIMHRLLYGVDFQILQAVMDSGKWTGTQDDLTALILPHCLGQPLHLPIREAIDWLHASIYTTIKTMKFSHLAPVCGGPVEVAVITSDRPFRWVRHKKMDVATDHGGISDAPKT